jgi:hypothetical protein
MSADEQVAVFDDGEGARLNATWSRSGKRLIVTVDRRGFDRVAIRRFQMGTHLRAGPRRLFD